MIDRRHGVPVVLGAFFISLRVFGQTPEELTARQTFIVRARKASNAGGHAQALSLAERAGEIQMTPSLRLFIAQEQFSLGELNNSMASAKLCVGEATRTKKLKNRRDILGTCNELLVKAQRSAGRIIVSMPDPLPPQTQVLVSGQAVPEPLYGRPYYVSPGQVRVEVTSPGHVSFQRELNLAAREEVAVTVSLPEETAEAVQPPATSDTTASAPQAPQPRATDETAAGPTQPFQAAESREAAVIAEKSEKRSEVGPYVVLGAGAASLGASAVFLVLRNNAFNDLDARCGGQNHSVCTDRPENRSLQSKASTYNVLTNVALGVGAAAVVGGAIWLFFEKKHGSGTPTHAELQITPTQGGAMVGIAGGL